jgi:glycosyltransferase involved in cell wall biosynthesis
MKILFVTQYYPPETGAPQNRLSDLARYLSQFGHTVTVLTALPNYPKGEVFEGYRGRLVMVEQVAGVKVIRTWIYTTLKRDFLRRLMNYFSFMLSSVLFGTGRTGEQDVVVVESPPLFLGLSGYFISRARRAELVLNISDLWPESAVAMGALRNRVLISLSERLEAFLYRHATLITGQTQGIVQSIRSRCPQKRVELITNGVDLEAFVSPSVARQAPGLKKEFSLAGKFVVGYAGLHGLAQSLETVIRAAQILADHQDIVFAFFGDGPEKAKLVQMVERIALGNLRFYPTQPRERMPEITTLLGASLIPLRRLDIFKGALPSKMFEAMAAGVPVIVSIEGEARTLVESAGAGICVEPENPQAMAEAILRLYENPEYRERLGQNGRRCVLELFDRRAIARTYENLLLDAGRFAPVVRSPA